MSTNIEPAFIKHFQSDVHLQYQRMGSKLRNTVRVKNNIVGSSTTFQKVGKGTASTKARHGKVPVMNVDHTPVECTLADYYAGDWVDSLDELKTNINERMVVAKAGAFALGRKTDELVITQLDTSTNYAGDGVTLIDGVDQRWIHIERQRTGAEKSSRIGRRRIEGLVHHAQHGHHVVM